MKQDIKPKDEQGNPHGCWLEYYSDGDLYSKGCFIHGKANGYWIYYLGDGTLDCDGCYIHGKKYGTWMEYYSDVDLIVYENYYKDKLIYHTSKNKFLI